MAKHLRFVVWALARGGCGRRRAHRRPRCAQLSRTFRSARSRLRPRRRRSRRRSARKRPRLLHAFASFATPTTFRPASTQPTGAGQTILIVTAYGSPSIQQDLAQFDAENGLPDPPSFTIVNQQTQIAPVGSGDLMTWAIETSLDVEYAHGMAPGAKIVLAVADNDDSTNFAELEQEVLPSVPDGDRLAELRRRRDRPRERPGFGGDHGQGVPEPGEARRHGHRRVGRPRRLGLHAVRGRRRRPMAGYPASSPFVLSVGGTMGNPGPDGLWSNGHYGGEQAWNEIAPDRPGSRRRGRRTERRLSGAALAARPDRQLDACGAGRLVQRSVQRRRDRRPRRHARRRRRHERRSTAVGGDRRARERSARASAASARSASRRRSSGRSRATRTTTARTSTTSRSATTRSSDSGSGLPGFAAGPGYDYATGLGTPDVSRLLKDLAGHDAQQVQLRRDAPVARRRQARQARAASAPAANAKRARRAAP